MKATLGRQFVVPVVLAAFALTGCAADHTGQTAARVGSQTVSTGDLTRFMDDLVNEQKGATVSSADRLTWQRNVLGYLIQHQIFSTIAAKAGVTASDADVNATVTALGGDAKIDTSLTSDHLPLSIKHTLLESLALETKLIDTWLPVSEADLQKAYNDQIGDYQQVNVKFVTATSQAQAEQIAAKVRATPDTFDAVATSILGADNAPTETGLQQKAKFGAGLADQLWAAKTGDVLAVNAEGAWRVLLITDHVQQPYALVRPQLLSAARGDKTQGVINDNISKLQESDPIVVNPRFGEWDSTKLQVVDATSDSVKKDDRVTDPLGTSTAPLDESGTATDGTGATDGSTGGATDGATDGTNPSGSPSGSPSGQ